MIGSLVATGRRRTLAAGSQRALIISAAVFAGWVIYANLFTISDPLILGILFVCGILHNHVRRDRRHAERAGQGALL